MAALGHTIAVVDKSGKVVSTSKHLFNVFKEAKCAYRERKAEIVAGRQLQIEEKRVHRLRLEAVEDERSTTSSRKSSKSKHTHRRSTSDRHHSSSSAKSLTSPTTKSHKGPTCSGSHLQFEQDLHVAPPKPRSLVRRHTEQVGGFTPPPAPRRTMSSPHIDMDLAYGDIPPPLPVATVDDELEIKGLVGKVKTMLEEADCLQYSATAIIASLQKNPDAMAAVALTLAEISNLAAKMAPGALLAMKGSAPAVFALLASPQFLIAAGVGVGITIVALGGFKVIKKIKAKNAEHAEQDSGMDELLEIGGDVSRIDNWRRGIAEIEEHSIGTSVDGEFITPQAAAISRLNLNEEEVKASRRKHKSSKVASESQTGHRSRFKDVYRGKTKSSTQSLSAETTMIASPQSHDNSSEEASTDLDLGNNSSEAASTVLHLGDHSSEEASTDLDLGDHSSEAASTDLYLGDTSSEVPSTDLYLGNRNEVSVSTNGDGNAPEETLRTSHQSGTIEKEAFSSIPCFDVEQLPPVKPHSEINLSGGSPKQYGDSAGAWEGKKTVCLDNSWEGSSRRDFDGDTRHGLPSPASSEEAHMTTTSLGDEKVIMEEDQNLDISTILSKEKERPMKLSPAKIHELTSTPSSLPLTLGSAHNAHQPMNDASGKENILTDSSKYQLRVTNRQMAFSESSSDSIVNPFTDVEDNNMNPPPLSASAFNNGSRSQLKGRAVSAPPSKETRISSKPPEKDVYYQASSSPPSQKPSLSLPPPLQTHDIKVGTKSPKIEESTPSPMPQSIPIPPLSLPTYLQLELSSHKPSPLYIHRSETSNFPYESSHVKLERLQNFLLLPPQLEQVLWFGALACLDAWLFSFTILPLRFLKALSILVESWARNLSNEVRLLSEFIYSGTGRMWRRRRRDSIDRSRRGSLTQIDPRLRTTISSESSPTTPRFPSLIEREHPGVIHSQPEADCKHQRANPHQHRRSKSMPSALLPDHKADILKGLLIVISCTILMYFDASRMYHSIRGQAAIKLYVIYNVLEVCDRLFSALGQDVLECLFSKETLERKSNGHSKILRPLWLFILALIYNLVHATSLFYQVITLNVAVNSYSNALLTLLMSNQFVEIKSTVFKKFEKENLFQLTCADVVERFQLWLMLTIIASRNFIETGGLSLGSGESSGPRTGTGSGFTAPLTGPSILPKSFTMFPEWTGQVMGPFLLVLGSEMLVDWIKHAYITKFNNTKPAIYGRFLDVLAKDYYSNAFADQNLTRRLGLPVIPLASLFIRASVQTYHMWLATNMPLPIPSASTSLSAEPETSSPAATAALQHIDHVFRRALGRSTFGAGSSSTPTTKSSEWTSDDMIAFMTMLIVFLVLFLVLLAFKLVLGMCLLSFARRRYRGMKEREKVSTYAEGKRVGGWGVVEVDEDKRRWIYKDDLKGARRMRERAAADGEKIETNQFYEGVSRYSMVAKRIW